MGIESSCDETGIALYDTEKGLLSNQLHSQIALHIPYGGVVPELASRDHLRHILPLTERSLIQAQKSLNHLDAIAYTAGPGLAGALLVGASFAHALALALDKPVIAVHHLEGHLLSPLLIEPRPAFPFIALLVSGGHTQLIAVEGIGQYQLLGETVDDAAGEAFDKSAKLLGLAYPGGPALSQLAQTGNPSRFQLPRPMLHSNNLEMSFSGLKTAVLQLVKEQSPLNETTRSDICAAVQEAIVDILVKKSLSAITQSGFKQLVVAGGVSANKALRTALNHAARRKGINTFYPPLSLCTDNGAMIAFTGAQRIKSAQTAGSFTVYPRWELTALSEVTMNPKVASNS